MAGGGTGGAGGHLKSLSALGRIPAANIIAWPAIIVVGFMFLYAFPLAGPVHSAIFVTLMSPLLLLTHSKAVSYFMQLIRHKVVVSALVMYLLAIVLSLAVAAFKETYDVSIVPTLVNNFASVVVALILSIVLYLRAREHDVSKLLTYLLVAQAIIILLMLILPGFREAIQAYTISDSLKERLSGYNNIRGMGLSGSVAFGLAVVMGALGFFMHYWFAFKARNLPALIKLALFVFTFIASISAGRTAVLGFALGFVFYLQAYRPFQVLKLSTKYFIISALFITAGLVYILSDPELAQIAYFFSRYAFQFVYSYMSGQGFYISSLEGLYNMYFLPPNENWWFGDGQYTGFDGNYYMHTDAGFMRFLLFFGVVGSLLMYLGYIWIALRTYFSIKGKVVAPGLTLLGLVFMGFVFHYKGEIVSFNVGFMKIFFLYCFYQLVHVTYLKRNGEA